MKTNDGARATGEASHTSDANGRVAIIFYTLLLMVSVAVTRTGMDGAGRRTYVLVNNGAEGNAPLTVEALVGELSG